MCFNDLVVQMMDMGQKIPTPDHVADMLNTKGWNVQQVARMWTVSTWEDFGTSWTTAAIDRLGGKGAAAKLWVDMKELNKTGFPKRQAQQLDSPVVKKFKMDVAKQPCIPPPPTTLVNKVGMPVYSIEDRPTKTLHTLGMPWKDSPSKPSLRSSVQNDSSPNLKPSRRMAAGAAEGQIKEKSYLIFLKSDMG